MSENHEEKNNDTNQEYCIDCATIKNIYTHIMMNFIAILSYLHCSRLFLKYLRINSALMVADLFQVTAIHDMVRINVC
jgi:hypothetical protein